MTKQYKASCLCKTITLSVTDFNMQAAHCHCNMCRKFHGAAFATLVSVKGLTWLSGLEHLQEFTAKNGTTRSFCHVCGSSVGFRVKGARLQDIEVAIALFDEPIPVSPDAHIYTDYKANWCTLNDDLNCFPEGRI